jgi:hypothetical protein
MITEAKNKRLTKAQAKAELAKREKAEKKRLAKILKRRYNAV